MEEKKFICKECQGTTMKEGKLSGIAAVRSLNAKTGLGGSEVRVCFCEKCGAVAAMYVEHPEAVK